MREPEFSSERGHFFVTFYKEILASAKDTPAYNADIANLLLFCQTPRTRKEICDYLGLSSTSHAMQVYVMPLVEQGLIHLSIPDKPKSTKQLYYSNK